MLPNPHTSGAMPGFLNSWRGLGTRAFQLGGVRLGARPWLVLGGGGVRGLAHLGALRVLSEAGLRPSGIVGTSIGALVGACLAAGKSIGEMEADALTLTREQVARMPRRLLWAQGIRDEALYRASVLRGYLEGVLPGGGWESLRTAFQTNAVELGSGETEWFGVGARTDVSIVDAVYASSALPVFYPPCRIPGGLYVDGGTRNALPLHRAEELGATGIVAVDVGAGERADAGEIVKLGMLAVHERVFAVMSGRHRRALVEGWSGAPLLYIRPEVDGFGTLEFGRLPEVIEAGRSAALASLGS